MCVHSSPEFNYWYCALPAERFTSSVLLSAERVTAQVIPAVAREDQLVFDQQSTVLQEQFEILYFESSDNI